jgi:hypothetical protein
MKLLTLCLVSIALTSMSCRGTRTSSVPWTDLFTGDPAQLQANFKGFQQDTVPAGWRVEEGTIALVESSGRDLVTREEFGDFDLALEWKISPRGNSGVMFRVSEDPQYSETYFTGPEMQVLDNATLDGDVNMKYAAGANYDLQAPPADFTKPVGEWNQARIVVFEGEVRYWLNGEICCTFELDSPEWKALVAASKFASMPGFGVQGRGKIALQDHGNPVWYRNIRIRRFD